MSKNPNAPACENCEFAFIYGSAIKGRTVRCLNEYQPVKFHACKDVCDRHRFADQRAVGFKK